MDVPGGYYFTQDIVEGSTQEQRGIVWLDNTRIMFKGHLLRDKGHKYDVAIYLWDIDRNEVVRYADGDRLCYADGTLYLSEPTVWTRPNGSAEPRQFSQRYRYGTLGKERPGLCTGDGRGRSEGCIGKLDMSCKPTSSADQVALLGPDSKVVVNLRSGDGLIAAKPSVDKLLHRKLPYEELVRLSRQSIVLVNQHYPNGKPLPIQEVEKVGSGFTAYSQYKQRYILVGAIPKDGPPGNFNNWPVDLPQPVYIMNTDGGVETTAIPKLQDWTAIHLAMPSQRGLVYWGSHGRTGGGLFLYDGQRNDALDRGQLRTFAVSGDGCKVAYAIIGDYGVGPSMDYRIKYMNLCGAK